MNTLNKTSMALSLCNEAEGLYLGKDLCLVRDPLKKASNSNEILKAITHVAVNALANKSVDSLKSCEMLRKAVRIFKDKNRDLSEKLVAKIDNIIALLFIKAFPEDKESCLTKELSLSDNVEDKMSMDDFVENVTRYIQEFIALPDADLDLDCIPEELLFNFNKIIEDFCKSTPKAAWLSNQLLPLSWARWELERNMVIASRGFDSDPESIDGESVLNGGVKKPASYSFKLLSHPRDVLFTEKKVYIVLKTLALAKSQSAQKINKWTKLGAEIVREDAVKKEKALFLEMKDPHLSQEEEQIQAQVNLASSRIHKSGPDAFTKATLQKIIAYQNVNKDKTLLCERQIDQLTINELLYKHKQADEEWIKLDLPIDGLQCINDDGVTFDKRSYEPFKRLQFLRNIGKSLRRDTLNLGNKKTSDKSMFITRESKAKLFLQALKLIEPKLMDKSEADFYSRVSRKIEDMVKASGKDMIYNLKKYQKIIFHRGVEGEKDYVEYAFEEPNNMAYKNALKVIEEIQHKLPLTVEAMLESVLKPDPKIITDKPLEAFSELVGITKKSVKPKKIKTSRVLKKIANQENQIKPLETKNDLDTVAKQISKISIIKAETIEKQAVKRPTPVLPSASSSVQYHKRVTRWLNYPTNSPKHPFNSDSKYLTLPVPLGEDIMKRIHIEHSLSLLADRFLDRGIKEEDEAKLAAYNVAERVDLVAAIETRLETGVTQKREGVIACSLMRKKDKRVIMHRTFIDLPGAMVDAARASSGWLQISEAVKRDGAAPHTKAKFYIQDDRSYLRSIVDGIVTIVDPKNSTTIRLALQ